MANYSGQGRRLLSAYNQAKAHFLGTRYSARSLRQNLESALADYDEITLDFDSIAVTQSFIDELLGVLVLKNGPEIVRRMIFRGCSKDVKEIIRFVIGSRTSDYLKANQH